MCLAFLIVLSGIAVLALCVWGLLSSGDEPKDDYFDDVPPPGFGGMIP